jgi:aminopeptidase N
MMDSLICDSVKQGGAQLVFSRPTGWLVLRLGAPLPSGESTAIDVFYRRRAGISNRGYFYIARGTYSPQCYTVAAPYDARYWFPCFDEPFDKAEQGCALNITVPDSFAVCANGLLDSVRLDSFARRKTFYWQHRYPISTYLIVFAASRWSEYIQYYHPGLPDSVEVRTFFWREDSSYVRNLLRNLPDMFAFYCDTAMFGAYPFERYGQVFVTGFQYGGMENQTLTMLALFLINESTVSHELSHMWWGDMVTCVDYRNVWLNEGFATYWDALYSERRNGRSNFLSIMNSRANSYFNEDAGHRFATYDPPLADVYAWGTIYCKGSWIQHMLRYIEGDTYVQRGRFFQALRAYGDSFKYGSASTEDYERIHEQTSGLNLDWFFNEWLYQAGYPQYRFSWSADQTGPDYRVITSIAQNNGNLAPPVFHMPVQLLLRTTHPDTLDTLAVVQVQNNPQVDTFLVSFEPESIRFDPGKWLLKKVTLTGIAEGETGPAECALQVEGPSLGHNSVRMLCRLAKPGELQVFDRAGRRQAAFRLKAGTSDINWDCTDRPSGVYLARLTGSRSSASAKLVIAH